MSQLHDLKLEGSVAHLSNRDSLSETAMYLGEKNRVSLKVWIASAAIAYALLFFLVISKTGIFRLALQLVYFLPSWLRMLLSRDTRNILLETDAVYILNFPFC